jgi:hypothetical protein
MLVTGTTPTIAAWDAPLDAPNIEQARIAHTFAPLAGVPGIGRIEAAYRQRFRLKSWQYMTAVSDDVFIAFVVGTAGFASNGFVYAAELKSGRVHKKFAITPLMMGTQLAPSSTAGAHRFSTRGLSVAIDNAGRNFDARVQADGIRAEVAFDSAKNDEHLALCVPLPGGRWNYTHKFAAFGVSGFVELGDKRYDMARGFGTMDFTKMYALRHAVWKWIAVCGRSREGRVIGLNLVDPTPEAPVSENALWVDGKRQAMKHVQIDRNSARADGLVMTLRDVAHVEQKLDVPLLRHRLHHVIGAFSGRIETESGDTHFLDDVVGIYEDYDTWW